MAYAAASDLQARIGASAMVALFDDNNTGTPDAATVASVLSSASGRVDSYLATSYKGPFPVPPDPTTGLIPSMIVSATVEWARALAYERHPEYERDTGKRAREEAEALCKRLSEGTEYLTDYTAQPTPSVVGGVALRAGTNVTLPNPGLPYPYNRNNGDF